MMSPVAVLVEVAGMAGQIRSPTNGAAYDPTSPSDFDPGAPVVTGVRGVPYKNDEQTNSAKGVQHFLIDLTERPAGLVPDVSQLALLNPAGAVLAEYTITDIQPRWWMGEIDGFTLTLKA